ncbi:MAG: hypothetical protein GEU74_02000 [Nitriliruptorales bacterium]|nr:hypothetical protein [Nitriliruptorales bacterium]
MDAWGSGVETQGSTWSAAQAAARQHTPLTLGDALDGMFRLLISNWRVYLVALGVLVIPFNAVAGWVTTEAMGGLDMWVNLIRDPADPGPGPTDMPATIGVGYAVVQLLSIFVVTPISWGLATHIAAGAYQGGTPTVAGVWRSTLQRYWALLGLMVLYFLVSIGIVLAAALVVGVAGAAAAATGAAAAVTAVVVAVLAAAAFCAWMFVKLMSFSLPAMIVERIGPGAALGRSWNLVRSRFWRLLGTWLLIMIILMVVSAVLIGGFALLGAPLGASGAIVGAFLGSIVLGLLTTPLVINAATLLYFDSRIRAEAYDLDIMTQQVTPQPPAATEPPFG